jgi:hypothetical protein
VPACGKTRVAAQVGCQDGTELDPLRPTLAISPCLCYGARGRLACLRTAALSALVGLFSQQAAEKLNQVFNTLFTPAAVGQRADTARVGTMADRVKAPAWRSHIQVMRGPISAMD